MCIIVAIISAIGICVFWATITGWLILLNYVTRPDYVPSECGSDMIIPMAYSSIGILWFGVVLAFWIFVGTLQILPKKNMLFRIIGSLAVTFASVGWILPLLDYNRKAIQCIFLIPVIKAQHSTFVSCYQQSHSYLKIVMIWLLLVSFCWSFFIASKLWGKNKIQPM
jgi:hypothetical protein